MNPIPGTVVTAFEPFLGRRRNRSREVVSRLPTRPGVEKVFLPVDFGAIGREIEGVLGRNPSALLLVGEAPGRRVRVEQIGVNVADSERPDNAGRRPAGRPLLPTGPLALSASWNAGEVAEAIARAGVRVRPSFHAGTYLCNAALYHALARAPTATSVGFLHVPRRPWPWGVPMVGLVRAVEIALEALEAVRR